MERKAIQPDKIVIREFRMIKGSLDSPFEFRVSGIKNFNYNVKLDTGVNLDENLIKADFFITVFTESGENTDEATASYHMTFIFYIENLHEHTAILEDASIDWNPYLANAIASITYSTIRGILWSRFQGTVFESFILPVVDPNELIRKESVESGMQQLK